MPQPEGWHSRGYLPHYDDGCAIQAITYRLADSLPAHVLGQLEEQTADDTKRRAAIERYLDAGHGSCALGQHANAEAVVRAWMHGNGVGYRLHAWVIMPNHVHVVAEPINGHSIGKIVAAWKSISARSILPGTATAPGRNSPRPLSVVDQRTGSRPTKRHLWQVDYYDRFIRNEQHYRAAVDYVHENPVKARLVARAEDWPWSSASRWKNGVAGEVLP